MNTEHNWHNLLRAAGAVGMIDEDSLFLADDGEYAGDWHIGENVISRHIAADGGDVTRTDGGGRFYGCVWPDRTWAVVDRAQRQLEPDRAMARGTARTAREAVTACREALDTLVASAPRNT